MKRFFTDIVLEKELIMVLNDSIFNPEILEEDWPCPWRMIFHLNDGLFIIGKLVFMNERKSSSDACKKCFESTNLNFSKKEL